MNWRCYVCGEPLKDAFILFSLNIETDRAFLAHSKCQAKLSDNPMVVLVTKAAALTAEVEKWRDKEYQKIPKSRVEVFNECADAISRIIGGKL